MIEALRSGRLRHAALDVFNTVTLPSDIYDEAGERDAVGAQCVPDAGGER